jgi:hypothetical protein
MGRFFPHPPGARLMIVLPIEDLKQASVRAVETTPHDSFIFTSGNLTGEGQTRWNVRKEEDIETACKSL